MAGFVVLAVSLIRAAASDGRVDPGRQRLPP